MACLRHETEENRGDTIYYDCLAIYISTTGHPGQKWNGIYGLTFSRDELAREEISLRAVIFRCVDVRLCAVKENEVDERGKVRNRIPRIDDEKAVLHLHDSGISITLN